MKRTPADVCTRPATSNSGADLLERELWFAARIAERTVGPFECPIFAGTTDRAIRAQRTRETILRFRLEGLRLFPSKPDTFDSLYQGLYGEPLVKPGIAA